MPSSFLSRSIPDRAGRLAAALTSMILAAACAATAARPAEPAAPTASASAPAAASAAAPSAAPPAAAPDFAPAAWDALRQRIPGKWIATTARSSVTTELRFIARQSALLELWGPPGRETATTYHPDGASLVATHYCAQGNQPRLRLTGGDALHPVLTLADSTDHADNEPMLVELSFDLSVPVGFDRVEIYRLPDGSLERTVWQLRPAP